MTGALDQLLAADLSGPAAGRWPERLEGKFLRFQRQYGLIAHAPAWTVYSRRGGFSMGRVEHSPQWNAWMFRPESDGVFPLSALAEIYVFMRDLGGRQV